MTTHEFNVRVLLFHENNTWVAQCLEYDFATQGSTTQIALDAFERIFVGQIALDIKCELEPLQDITQAPDEYFELFESALHLKERREFQPIKDSFEHLILASADDVRIHA